MRSELQKSSRRPMQEATKSFSCFFCKVLANRTNALKFKIGRQADFNDMLFRGKVRMKPKSKVPYFPCELNAARDKRDGVLKRVSNAKLGRRETDSLCYFHHSA